MRTDELYMYEKETQDLNNAPKTNTVPVRFFRNLDPALPPFPPIAYKFTHKSKYQMFALTRG